MRRTLWVLMVALAWDGTAVASPHDEVTISTRNTGKGAKFEAHYGNCIVYFSAPLTRQNLNTMVDAYYSTMACKTRATDKVLLSSAFVLANGTFALTYDIRNVTELDNPEWQADMIAHQKSLSRALGGAEVKIAVYAPGNSTRAVAFVMSSGIVDHDGNPL